jgi:glycine/D-amino acid oxidase-like deaminating enzyme
MRSIEECCYWLASREVSGPSVPLKGDVKADIAIVGAGFTGLWTALFLKQLAPDRDVAVVEQGVAGYGASGRNAGIVSECLDHSHGLAISHFGREETAELARIGLQNIDELQAYALDCDFERSGQLHVALTPGHIEDFESSIAVARELGLSGHRLLNEQEAQQEINSPLYKGALFAPGGGIVNPVKLVDKIKRDATELGVRFYERTKVEKIAGNTIRASSGTIVAEKIIMATDAYTHHLFPELLWHFIPLYDYIIVSQPLTAAQKEQLRWHNRQGVTDGRTFFNYYRLTADNRILWGTSEAFYYSPNRVDESCDHSEQHYRSLKDSFVRHFPYLSDLEFPYAWGGPIASTTRLTPFFGTLSGGKVIYALGYTGHGIGTTRVAGKVLAHMALAKQNELLKLKMVNNKPFPYPPEPIRSVAVNVITRSLQKVDAGEKPDPLLKLLDAFGIGFSS